MGSRFSGKITLVAGGTGGLGQAVSLAFLREGARVHVTYRSQDEFSRLQQAAGEAATSLVGHRADLTDDNATAELVRQLGQLHIVVNAIGAYAGGSPLWETSLETFDRQIALNVRSGFVLARHAIPAMLSQSSGVFIDISSQAAVNHAAGAGAYVASKAAALAMMDSLAADVKGKGIRVNTVLPSIIDTPANRQAMPGADFSKWPKPEEIADVILFLASNQSKLIHGAAIPVYGAD
jgi:NAD(P)-dependent dehydrogenase (short-subunit alcohol dehydrogenase family)